MTNADEIVFYEDGVFYQAAYLLRGDQRDEQVQEQMLQMVKELVGGTP